MKHRTDVDYPGGLEKLAADLAELRYDALCFFLVSGSRRHDDSRCKACPDATVSGSLKRLTFELTNDALDDGFRGRPKLANNLNRAANAVSDAWAICDRYMKDGDEQQVEKG